MSKKPITASKLRANIYRILDEILETGVPVDISRQGRRLRITLLKSGNKLDRLKKRSYLRVDPEEIVHMDCSNQWQADDPS